MFAVTRPLLREGKQQSRRRTSFAESPTPSKRSTSRSRSRRRSRPRCRNGTAASASSGPRDTPGLPRRSGTTSRRLLSWMNEQHGACAGGFCAAIGEREVGIPESAAAGLIRPVARATAAVTRGDATVLPAPPPAGTPDFTMGIRARRTGVDDLRFGVRSNDR